jgi:hypothetical protein
MACGAFVSLPALFLAVMSAGAGHGDYIAARMLFPYSMLLILVEGSIGALSQAVGLLQFPLYGALLGWSLWRRSWGAAILVATLHVIAAAICFAGILPYFSC